MPELRLPDTIIHYEDEGAGPPLLLLHGGLGTALLHFHRDIPFFAQHYRVIAPDLRGYGRSSPPRRYPPDFYHRDAADMAALLDAVTAEPAHVLGWSDGAIVALILAVNRPDLVRSLVVWGGQASILPQERAAWERLIDLDTWPEHTVQRVKEAQGPANWPEILPRMLAGYNAVLDGGGDIIAARLAAIRAPVLIIHGEDDPTVPVVHARTMHAAIPQSELHTWAGVGHMPHRERQDEFRALVLDFLARH
jgi:valacyclovir hydrolase